MKDRIEFMHGNCLWIHPRLNFKTVRHSRTKGRAVYVALAIFMMHFAKASPPFGGTIFLDPDIITESDPTTYQKLTDADRGERNMYDRRSGWVYLNAFLFNASFNDGADIEIQVNPEFGDADVARAEALKYAPVIGRLPKCLRKDVETVWIHMGNNPFGGGNDNLLIHTGQAAQYSADGILEETLVHEAAHTSLDAPHANASEWLAAQDADGEFISTYARDNPYREDIAESFLPYFAFRYRSDRITESLADVIAKTIPNRIAYFDKQEFDAGETSQHSWNLAEDRGSGWKSFDWFGYYYGTAEGWIYHSDLGWLHKVSSKTDSIWFYFPNHGWMWTKSGVYPFLYDADTSGWRYYKRIGGKAMLYDYATGS